MKLRCKRPCGRVGFAFCPAKSIGQAEISLGVIALLLLPYELLYRSHLTLDMASIQLCLTQPARRTGVNFTVANVLTISVDYKLLILFTVQPRLTPLSRGSV